MDNMLLDLGQCLTSKVIGISIRVYKFFIEDRSLLDGIYFPINQFNHNFR